MLSQYTWFDFIKFALALAIPYYLFVAWKYYREDIREWISSRGSEKDSKETPAYSEEDETESLYSVNHYADSDPQDYPAVTLAEGIVLADEQPLVFDMPLGGQVVRPQELSIAEVINTAQRIKLNEQGQVTALNSSDTAANQLAGIINGQNDLLAGVPFNR